MGRRPLSTDPYDQALIAGVSAEKKLRKRKKHKGEHAPPNLTRYSVKNINSLQEELDEANVEQIEKEERERGRIVALHPDALMIIKEYSARYGYSIPKSLLNLITRGWQSFMQEDELQKIIKDFVFKEQEQKVLQLLAGKNLPKFMETLKITIKNEIVEELKNEIVEELNKQKEK